MAGIPKGRFSGWFYASLGVISIYLLLLIIKWQALPVFIDIYYHSSCMTGFRDAGGIVLHDFWELAPAGRPHLYPPLFHVIMLALNKLGFSPLAVTRIASVAIYPALLTTILFVLRKLYNDRLAFLTILMAASSYIFFVNVMVAIPATIGLIIFILIFYALENRKILSGILLLGLLFYTHGAIPWMAVLTMAVYGILRREAIKPVLIVIFGGILLGSPWLIHMIRNRDYFITVNNYLNNYYEANIFLYIFTFFGMLTALKRKKGMLFYFAMLAATIPLAKDYTFRFLCGEGLLPLIFFAGVGLDDIYGRAAQVLKGRGRRMIHAALLPWVVFYLFTFFAPVISRNQDAFSYETRGSTFSKITARDPAFSNAMASTIYVKKYMEELFKIINANSRPDELIYSNYGYVAGLFYTFCDRATTCAMLNEVKPLYYSNPVINAALFVWLKNPERYFEPELKLLIKRLGLIEVAETEFAHVYRNPVVIAHKTVARPVVPSAAAFFILAMWIFLIVWSFVRK